MMHIFHYYNAMTHNLMEMYTDNCLGKVSLNMG